MARITVNCRFCGEVYIDPLKANMRARGAEGSPVFDFECPLCSMDNTEEISVNKAMLMMLSGMPTGDGRDTKGLIAKGLDLEEHASSDDEGDDLRNGAEWFMGVYKFDQLN